jgi:hypothetical protein
MLIRPPPDRETLFRTGTHSRAGTRNEFASHHGERKRGTYAEQSLARPLHLESALRTTAEKYMRDVLAVRIEGRATEGIVEERENLKFRCRKDSCARRSWRPQSRRSN